MPYQSILTVLTGTSGDKATLSVVDRVAEKFAAHVDVLHVRTDPMSFVSYAGDGMSVDVYSKIIETAERENASRAEVARQAFESWTEARSIPLLNSPDGRLDRVTASWHEQTGTEGEAVIAAGRVSDLVVMGSQSEDAGAAHDTAIERAMFGTGRPVLLCPAEEAATVGDNIAVLWNGSAEAARAVDAALPLLARADQIHILSVNEGTGPEPAQSGLPKYLAWHGIEAALTTFEPDARTAGEALLDEAKRMETDLVVMGAYGHSRLRELILGGVTRHMLDEDHPPILAVH